MSQFYSDDFKQSRSIRVRSELPAIGKGKGALILSLLFFVPLAPFAGLAWGVWARIWNFRKSAYGGAITSTLAIVLGLLIGLGQVYVGNRGVEYLSLVRNGPETALVAGFGHDTGYFSTAFDLVAEGNHDNAETFLNALESRYGTFHAARLNTRGASGEKAGFGGPHHYELIFERGVVQAQAAFRFENAIGKKFLTSKLEYLAVRDPEHGNLVFPASGVRMMTREPADY